MANFNNNAISNIILITQLFPFAVHFAIVLETRDGTAKENMQRVVLVIISSSSNFLLSRWVAVVLLPVQIKFANGLV